MDVARLGMPSLPLLGGLDAHARLCLELGLSFVELNMNLPAFHANALDASALRAWMRQGVDFTLHLDERLDPMDFNPLVAKAYLQTGVQAVALAASLELPVVNMHLPRGVYFTLPAQRLYLYQAQPAPCLGALARFRDEMERAALGRVRVCVENTSGFTGFERQCLELLLQSPAFGLCLDVGHDRCTGGQDGRWMLEREGRLGHMHLHDVLHRRDHLALGQGEVDVSACLALAERLGLGCVVEVKEAQSLRDSLLYLRGLGKI